MLYKMVRTAEVGLTELDLGGWFRRQDGKIVLAVSKHASRSFADVVAHHPDYIRSILAQPLLDDARSRIEAALNRRADKEPVN